jgi:3-oxoacyl-[acyl-carrier protein] reductase
MPTGMNLDLAGRTALVCGASAGIGAASAKLLAAQGARVIALARREDQLKKLVSSLPGQGHRYLVADLMDRTALASKVKTVIGEAGGAIEILVSNSSGPKGGPILDATEQEFLSVFEQHMLSGHTLAQLLVPGMKDRGFGRIVNVISTSVKQPIPNLGVSNTIRWAVASWAKTLATELAPFGITVNSVLPGYTETDRLFSLLKVSAGAQKKSEEEIAEEWKKHTPMRRFGKPEEIASAVAFFASPAAAYITGTALAVDGGRTGSL